MELCSLLTLWVALYYQSIWKIYRQLIVLSNEIPWWKGDICFFSKWSMKIFACDGAHIVPIAHPFTIEHKVV